MSQTSFIHGFHAVIAKLRHQPRAVLEIFVAADRHDARVRDLLKHAELHAVRVVPVDAARLEGMAGGGHRHQGVVARVSSEARHVALDDVLDTLEEPPFLLILDGVQDPHNLGACLRTADAAGALAVIVPKDKSATLNATVRKVACGAAEVIPLVAVTNLARTLEKLQQRGLWIVGTAGEATQMLYELDLTGPTVLVMGAEGKGMRRLTRDHCDYLAKLPMQGSVSSLNVSVATGVCLFEIVRQRQLKTGA